MTANRIGCIVCVRVGNRLVTETISWNGLNLYTREHIFRLKTDHVTLSHGKKHGTDSFVQEIMYCLNSGTTMIPY